MEKKNFNRGYAQLTYVLSKSINRRFPQVGEEFSAQVSAYVTYKLLIGANQFEIETELLEAVEELNTLYRMALPTDFITWVAPNAVMFNRIINPLDYEEDGE
jgi:hypothetical protein